MVDYILKGEDVKNVIILLFLKLEICRYLRYIITMMNKNSEKCNFEGQEYFDDRLFVLYLCKGTVEIETGEDGLVWTRIYHEEDPKKHVWCVVTYRNCNRYPLYRIDSFYKKEDAQQYIKEVEPETPLISLGGKSPAAPLSHKEYKTWKEENGLNDYNWRSMYSLDGTNAFETVTHTKKQFKGIK